MLKPLHRRYVHRFLLSGTQVFLMDYSGIRVPRWILVFHIISRTGGAWFTVGGGFVLLSEMYRGRSLSNQPVSPFFCLILHIHPFTDTLGIPSSMEAWRKPLARDTGAHWSVGTGWHSFFISYSTFILSQIPSRINPDTNLAPGSFRWTHGLTGRLWHSYLVSYSTSIPWGTPSRTDACPGHRGVAGGRDRVKNGCLLPCSLPWSTDRETSALCVVPIYTRPLLSGQSYIWITKRSDVFLSVDQVNRQRTKHPVLVQSLYTEF